MGNSRSIKRTFGREAQSVGGYVKALVDAEGGGCPILTWAEPDANALNENGGPGPYGGFHPLVVGVPDWPPDLRLVEARLFWKDAALDIVADGDASCRWARIDEGTGDETVHCSETPLLTLRDWRRFGLDKPPAIDRLTAIEYRNAGRLVAWRLVIPSNPGATT